jgi:hypothetical protein
VLPPHILSNCKHTHIEILAAEKLADAGPNAVKWKSSSVFTPDFLRRALTFIEFLIPQLVANHQ